MLYRPGFWFGLLLLALGVQAEEAPIRYRVRFSGVTDRQLLRDLRAASVMIDLADRPPLSEIQLRRRAERDPPRFQTVLRGHGFYDARIDTQFDLDRRRPRVRFVIEPGEPYTLRRIQVLSPDGAPLGLTPEQGGLIPGEIARTQAILGASELWLRALRDAGHPFPQSVDREVRILHADRAVDIRFTLDPGPVHRVGPTTFSGLSRVEERFLRRKLPWEEGDLYEGAQIRLARRRFAEADLFNSIRVFALPPEAEADPVPILVELQERNPRSITLGVGYSNDEGWRARAGWVHRNLLRRGERLSLDGQISEQGDSGEIAFRRPDFRRLDQALILSARQSTEDTRAFFSRKTETLARVERPLGNDWRGSAGVGARTANVEDARQRERYRLLYLPLFAEQDRSDDLLDPRRGHRFSVGGAPYWDPWNEDLFFFKTRITYTQYLTLSRRREIDWAGRAAYAVAAGVSRDQIPADERLYAGGGGTLRGYRFQTVGPLEDGQPVGGRSMILLSQEIRWRMTSTLGLTTFVDGGTVTEEAVFDGDVDEFRWGAGIGLRYFTPVGPLRADLAFPINRRDIDSPWQVYISLGQAF